jgi:hypothetical protein
MVAINSLWIGDRLIALTMLRLTATIAILRLFATPLASADEPSKSDQPSSNYHEQINMETALKALPSSVQEFMLFSSDAGSSSKGETLAGQAYATAQYIPATAARKHPTASDVTMTVSVHRYSSPDEAKADLLSNLHRRPAVTPDPRPYKGGLIFQYSGKLNTMILIQNYVIELTTVTAESQALILKSLDSLLKQLALNS